jgi:RNA polymerase sigma-70 factor, ECF subfamily
MENDSDHTLMAAAARGDAKAFELLYRRYELRVCNYLRSFVRDASMAEDLLIETMTDVWRFAGRFEARSSVSTWILGIARHKALDAVRKHAWNTPTVAIDASLPISDPATSPQDKAVAQGEQQSLHQVIARLSPEHQEVLRLAFFEDLPYGEIATLLGIPANTVKSRVYYAKEHLRALLASQPDPGPPQP